MIRDNVGEHKLRSSAKRIGENQNRRKACGIKPHHGAYEGSVLSLWFGLYCRHGALGRLDFREREIFKCLSASEKKRRRRPGDHCFSRLYGELIKVLVVEADGFPVTYDVLHVGLFRLPGKA